MSKLTNAQVILKRYGLRYEKPYEDNTLDNGVFLMATRIHSLETILAAVDLRCDALMDELKELRKLRQ